MNNEFLVELRRLHSNSTKSQRDWIADDNDLFCR